MSGRATREATATRATRATRFSIRLRSAGYASIAICVSLVICRVSAAEDRGVALLSPAIGRALNQHDPGGWAGRLEMGALSLPGHGVTDAFFGGSLGVAGWVGSHRGGFSIPLHGFVGLNTPRFFASIGGGLFLFELDHLGNHTGSGFVAPFASVGAGITIGGFRIGVDMRPAWRWKHSGDATTQGQNELMLVVGIPVGGKP